MADNLTDIAIIGMAGRFPGASDVGELWRNLCEGRESIRHFAAEELVGEQSRALARFENYVKARAILDDADKFDASFFGIYPREAELIDPQQRVFLECCWHAFEDAGYDPLNYKGVAGVFAGCSPNSYFMQEICADHDFIGEYVAGYQVSNFITTLGTNFEFLPTRVAYKLNLKGPAFSLNCGCSTSLVAISQACLSLQNYQIDMALAGGVSITFPQKRGYLYEPGGMVSPDGHCRTFDEDAQGTVFGDGAAVVLLKRLEDALADRDHVYAVIKGFGITNDGSAKVGFAAPGVEGQARAIAMAHAAAGVEPRSISYVEAHGTGTLLGDAIEIAALTKVFRQRTQERGFCAIGAVKTNIGHLDVAAGATGLIKTALSLYHKLLPPMLHFRRPSPRLSLEDSPFYVNASLAPLQRGNNLLRAGVSAFGIGGTNAHIVMEEAPESSAVPTQRGAHLIVLSAKTDGALEAATDNLAAHLKVNPACELADIAHTLMVGRHPFVERRFAVVHDLAEAVAVLSSREPSRVVSRSCKADRLDVAFMFSGQGAQYVGMGRQIYAVDAGFRADLDQCMSILKSTADLDLARVLYPESATGSGQIDDTSFAQPAIFAVEYALARLWMRLGIRPAAMIGHSVGEFVAACLAGVFSLDRGLHLIAERGRLMQALPRGAMLSIRLSETQVTAMLDDRLSLAAINGPSLTVVAGPEDAVAQLEARLGKEQIVCRRLRTSHAFHSAMMDPVREPFAQIVRGMALSAPKIPFVSGVTGTWISDTDANNPEYWANHLCQPVRFASGIGELRGSDCALLEVGPGNVLSVLARQQPAKHHDQMVVASMPDRSGRQTEEDAMLNALGQLWLWGANPGWPALYEGEKRRRVSLPQYPFERKRSWIGTAKADLSTAASVVSTEQPATSDRVAATASSNNAIHGSSTGGQHLQEAVAPPLTQQATGRRKMESTQPFNREVRVHSILEYIFQDLSGIDVSAGGGSATFLELGFDSLFLTQVSQALQSKFRLKITFRQLLDKLSTLGSLAAYINEHLAPDALPATAPAAAELQSHSVTVATPSQHSGAVSVSYARASVDGSAAPMTGAADLEALFKTQLQMMSDLMSKQLEVLRSAGNAASAQQINGASKSETASTPPAIAVTSTPPAPTSANGNGPQPRKFLPFRPIEASAVGALSPVQKQHLRALIERYNRKTAGSKRFTEAHRGHLADPRVAAGFRAEWKELVYPIVTVRSKGSKLWDVDGNEYIDVVNGYGPIMFGHAPEFVTRAVAEQLERGYETGPQTPLAGEVADLICEMTGMDRVTFCNTGSEAVTAALRVARTVTGRNKVVLFTGAYHGMFDEVVVKGVPGPDGPRSLPVAPGIPREKVENVVVLDYATPEALSYIESHANELAAVLVEPVQSRHPGLRPVEFLKRVRHITEQSGAALIFDEVVTGFRVHPAGCQATFGIKADLATYGKVLAGGLPIGILAGRSAFMDALDGGQWKYGDDSFPETGVTFFAGTFVRHPLALAAALAVLKHLKDAGPDLQDQLAERTSRMAEELNAFLEARQVPTRIDSFSSFAYFTFPTELKYAGLFHYYMRERGVYIQEGFPMFLTTAHSDDDLVRVVHAFKESIIEMQTAGFLAAPTSTALSTNDKAGEPRVLANGHVPARADPEAQIAPAAATGAASVSTAMPRAPITESQLEILLSAKISDEASCAYNESFTLKLRGELDTVALVKALNLVIARHDALRTSFSEDGEQQEFAPSLVLDLPLEDLSALDESARRDHLDAIVGEEAHAPFDLNRGPMVRARLIKVGAREHHLLFTSHHIVCDGWSTNVILDELSKSYGALRDGRACDLSRPISFASYAEAQAQHFTSPQGTAIENYWLAQFKRPAPLLDLPLDRRRPSVRSYDGATCRRHIPAETYRAIKKAGAQHKCTLFATLLAGFQALLSRLSGQDDIVVGIPAAGQSLLEGETLVGHCVSFLPLRGNLADDPPISSYLAQVGRTLLDAYEHQNYTYGRLIRRLAIRRDPSRLPLLEVQFNLERVGSGMEFLGLDMEVDPSSKAFVNQDLFLNVIESDDGLVLDCDYSTSLFDEATIDRWLSHYQTLLEGIAADASQRVSRLPLLSCEERKRLVEDCNITRADYPRDRCVHQLFEEQAARTPDAIAAVYEDQQLSYAELNQRADRFAAHLRHLGVGPGLLAGVYVERSLDMLIALLGVLKTGAAYVPMDPTYPAQRVAFVLEDTKAPVLLTQQSLAQNLGTFGARVVCLDAALDSTSSPSGFAPAASNVGPEDLAYVIYTSGSTGTPKGVEITHRALVNLLSSMRKKPGLDSRDTLLAVTTLSFDIAGLELFLPLCVGAKLVIASRETAADGGLLLKRLVSSGATVMQATPITFRLLIEAGWNGSPQLKILCGGEALPRELANQLVERSESVWNMYGPTETTIWSSTVKLSAGDGPVPIGQPIDNTQFYVLDGCEELTPLGRPGELYIGGDGLARGYFRRPELTAEKFGRDVFRGDSDSRLYRTGDLVRRREDGTLEFLGRLDHQVKLRGYRIELGEIETALSRYPGVREVVVALREDIRGDKRLVAYIVTDQEALTVTAIREFLAGKLPNYMLPSAVVRMHALPLTPNGKMDRRALPAPEAGRTTREQNFIAPQTEQEKTLAGIWSEVLRLDRVGIRDDLFELGADSLHIFQIAARANRAGIRISPAKFLKYRTITELLAQVDSEAENGAPMMSVIVPVSREKYRVKRSSLAAQGARQA